MKLRAHRPAGQKEVHHEINRARAIIGELKSNNEKAHELTHTLNNLRTVQRFIREQIHRPALDSLQAQAIPRITTWRITKELHSFAIEVEKMKKEVNRAFDLFLTQPLRCNTRNYKRGEKEGAKECCEAKGQEDVALNEADKYDRNP